MSTIPGTWDLSMKTPIGTIAARYTFAETADGLTGSATSGAESVPLESVVAAPEESGERVTWKQSITKPLRLNLDFEVVVTGDELAGHSRAGRLPATRVSGHRVG